MSEICIIAFNLGNAGKYVNGPGMCLVNYVKELKQSYAFDKVHIFTKLKSNWPGAKSISDKVALYDAIKRSTIVQHWSGISKDFYQAIKLANFLKKAVIVGPNVLDGVKLAQERNYMRNIDADSFLVVNKRQIYQLSKLHNISRNLFTVYQPGPDDNLWTYKGNSNGKILWKGNSKQMVKDVGFALEIKKRLPQYDFDFIGYPNPYDYMSHIPRAKSAHLYVSTSLSETMGLALMEQWLSGVPSITHPKIYMHGENYKTGIITNRTVDDYCEAIIEVMEDSDLREDLSFGAVDYMVSHWRSNYNTLFNLFIDLERLAFSREGEV